jgi:hypothetical protein
MRTALKRTRAIVLGITGTGVAAAVVGLALPAGAASVAARAAASGTEHFQAMNTTTSQTSTTNPLIAWGLFTAPGTDHQNPNGTDTFVFPGGTFTVLHTPAKGGTKQSFNVKTCLLQVSQNGTFKVEGGTGKYKGISGGGTYVLSLIGISTRLKSGACNPSMTAPLAAQQLEIAAVGKVSLP